jgi:hypothetical protein
LPHRHDDVRLTLEKLRHCLRLFSHWTYLVIWSSGATTGLRARIARTGTHRIGFIADLMSQWQGRAPFDDAPLQPSYGGIKMQIAPLGVANAILKIAELRSTSDFSGLSSISECAAHRGAVFNTEAHRCACVQFSQAWQGRELCRARFCRPREKVTIPDKLRTDYLGFAPLNRLLRLCAA